MQIMTEELKTVAEIRDGHGIFDTELYSESLKAIMKKLHDTRIIL